MDCGGVISNEIPYKWIEFLKTRSLRMTSYLLYALDLFNELKRFHYDGLTRQGYSYIPRDTCEF